MELIENTHSYNLKEEIEEFKSILNKNPKGAIELIDSLVEKSEKVNDIKLKAEVYHIKALVLHENSQYDSAIEWYNKSLILRQTSNDKRGEAISLNNIGLAYLDSGKLNEAIHFLELSLAIKKSLNDYQSITATYENLGVAYQKLSNYKQAIEIFYRSLKISEEHNDTVRMATTYQNIGVVHYLQDDIEYALAMFQKALSLNKGHAATANTIQLKNNVGAMFKLLKQYESAIACFQQCLQMSEEVNYKTGITAALNNLCEVYREQGNLGEALETCLKCLQLAKESENKLDEINATMNMAEIYLLQKSFKKTEDYLQRSQALAVAIQDLQKQKEISFLLSQLFEKKGNTTEALVEFKKYDSLKSLLLNNENSKTINELKTKYEVEKAEKENEINRLKNIELKGALENLHIEKQKSESLLLNILPSEIADELKDTGKVKAKYFDSVSVMFCDIKDFTKHCENLSPDDLVRQLDFYFQSFDEIIGKYDIEKIKTIGDAYMCVSGLPNATVNHPVILTNAAIEMVHWLGVENQKRKTKNEIYFEFRFGIHSGPAIAGIVGKTKFEYDIWGDTVNTAARMEQSGEEGKINISGATHKLIKEKFNCIHRGKIEAKHKGFIDMYFVADAITT